MEDSFGSNDLSTSYLEGEGWNESEDGAGTARPAKLGESGANPVNSARAAPGDKGKPERIQQTLLICGNANSIVKSFSKTDLKRKNVTVL